jgi:hypothetical protein
VADRPLPAEHARGKPVAPAVRMVRRRPHMAVPSITQVVGSPVSEPCRNSRQYLIIASEVAFPMGTGLRTFG